jgi:hypothetical protein
MGGGGKYTVVIGSSAMDTYTKFYKDWFGHSTVEKGGLKEGSMAIS